MRLPELQSRSRSFSKNIIFIDWFKQAEVSL